MNVPHQRFRPPSQFPPVVMTLIVVNVAFFLAQGAVPALMHYLALWPLGMPNEVMTRFGLVTEVPQFWPWQLFSYGFLHGGFGHLFFNLFALWMFGTQLENQWGPERFAIYYVVCVLGAGLTQLIYLALFVSENYYPTIGASGGVFGILLAFGLLYPNQRIMLLIPPVPIPAKYFVIGYGALELFFGITGTQQGVAHFAHLGGMVAGYLLLRGFRVRRR